MSNFTDRKGREWVLDVNTQTIHDVQAATGVLLTKLFDDNFKLYAELMADPPRLAAVIWTIVFEQAEQLNVTDREFKSAIKGDAYHEAYIALGRAFSDFCPSQERREIFHALLDKAVEAEDQNTKAAATVAREELNKIDLRQLGKTFTDSALNTPESQASIRGATATANCS